MRVAMTGATGFVGRRLGPLLVADGHEVVVISRDAASARSRCPFAAAAVEGDLTTGPLASPEFDRIDAVVHLMGEPIADGRWTKEKKRALVDSRVLATRHLRESLGSTKVIVSASAIGYYGDREDEELDESSSSGDDFLADLCARWEEEVRAFQKDGARAVFLRQGIILSASGGALPKLLGPFRAGFGGPLAGGRQWMSWIHLDDVAGLYRRALEDSNLVGAVNAVSPFPVRNAEFTRSLARALHRPAVVPVPEFALKLAFGEKSSILTASQRVLPRAAERAGYSFLFRDLKQVWAAEL